jgi:predicted nucleic acid-binding protein
MYLVDTNVWLERLLDQTKADEVGHFLDRISPERLYVTDFAFHSICVVMVKLDRKEGLSRFVQDTLIDGAVSLIVA